jgi:hypothetical protein
MKRQGQARGPKNPTHLRLPARSRFGEGWPRLRWVIRRCGDIRRSMIDVKVELTVDLSANFPLKNGESVWLN